MITVPQKMSEIDAIKVIVFFEWIFILVLYLRIKYEK